MNARIAAERGLQRLEHAGMGPGIERLDDEADIGAAPLAEGFMEGADHGDRVFAHEERARVEGEEEQGRLFGEPEARAADRRDLAKLDRNRHAQYGNVDGLRERSAHELRRRPDLLKARQAHRKARRNLGELPERAEDVGAAGKRGGPQRADRNVGADQAVADEVRLAAKARLSCLAMLRS